MTKFTFLLSFPVLAATLISCGNSSTEDRETIRTERIDSVELIRTGELRFVMDEETSPNLLTTFYDENSGFYYFHNTITGHIERFHTDSTTKSPVSIKVPGRPWGINVASPDSIYLLYLEERMIRLIDGHGSRIRSYAIDEVSDIMPGGEGQPYLTPQGLAYTGTTTDDGPCLVIIDDKTGQIVEKHFPYPEIYQDFYGDLLMRTPYSAYNSGKSLAVVGFPADDNIHVLNLATKETTIYHAESKYRGKKPKPLGKGLLGGITISPEREIEYFREITSYGNILYDRWNNVYYRIVEKSTPMPGVNLSNKAKHLAVLILDENFRTIGESDVTEDAFACFRYTVFVSQTGLHIQLLTGEEEMVFAAYTLKKME